MNNVKRLIYYMLSITGILVCVLAVLMAKGVATIASIGVIEYFKGADWATLLATVCFFIVLGIAWPVCQWIVGAGLRLVDYSKHYKRSYSKEFGEGFEKPLLITYGLAEKEYYAYNRRFQFDLGLVPMLSALVVIIIFTQVIRTTGLVPVCYATAMAIATFILVRALLRAINLKLSKRYGQHDQVVRYQIALDIYERIQEELRENRLSSRSNL